ncbi:hypothetical protein Taro_056701, partial [Colocasia esculenta]|nr:hypothetical protein [Colocasia esculenta]
MARNGDLLSIDVFDWRYMQEQNINECLELVRTKFEFEDRHENYVVASLSKKWKDYKERLKKVVAGNNGALNGRSNRENYVNHSATTESSAGSYMVPLPVLSKEDDDGCLQSHEDHESNEESDVTLSSIFAMNARMEHNTLAPHHVFLHNRREQQHKKNKQEFKPLDQAFARQDLRLLALRANNLNKALSQNYTGSLRISITAQRAKS